MELAIICIFRDLNLKVIPASFLGSAPNPMVFEQNLCCNSMALWWWGCNRDHPRGAPFGDRKVLLFKSSPAVNYVFDLSFNVRLLWFGSFDKTKPETEKWCIWFSACIRCAAPVCPPAQLKLRLQTPVIVS